jgi:D-glycero-alpha-D-manno-heptose-7-phosphate kinase
VGARGRATGAKLTDAGGGGFLLVIYPEEWQRAARRSLADMRELVKLGRLGSRVVLNMMRDMWGLIRQQG